MSTDESVQIGVSVRQHKSPPVTLGTRLRDAIVARGHTLAAFAAETKIPYRTLQNYLADNRKPGAEHLAKMLDAGIDMTWLLTGRTRSAVSERAALDALSGGDGELRVALRTTSRVWELLPSAERAQYAKVLETLNNSVIMPVLRLGHVKGIPNEWLDPRTLYGDLTHEDALVGGFDAMPHDLPNAVPIPVCSEVEDDQVDGYLAFNPEWLDRRGIDARGCVVMCMQGGSMEPTIAGGAHILVDRGRRTAREGRAYVVTDNVGAWMVNRVVRDGKIWVLASDNPDLSRRAWLPGTELAGEVVWASRALPY